MSADPSAPFNVQHLKKAAKQLLRACRSEVPEALARVRAALPRMGALSPVEIAKAIRLADVHQALARERGAASWADLVSLGEPLSRFLARVRGQHVHTLRRELAQYAPLVSMSIHAAAALGHAAAVREHVDRDGSLAVVAVAGWTPLAYVCASPIPRFSARHAAGLLGCATILLDAGATLNGALKPDATADADPSPIVRAFMHGNLQVITLLLKRGLARPSDYLKPFVQRQQTPDWSTLHSVFAEYFQRADVQQRANALRAESPTEGDFARRFADPFEEQQLRMPNLIGAREDLWRALLDRGYDVTAVSSTGRSALHSAAAYAPPTLMALFLDRGIDPHVRDAAGRSVFAAAVRSGNLEVAELLRGRGVDDDASAIDLWLGCCLAGDEMGARRLVSADPDLPNRLTREDADVFVRAAGRGNLAQVRLMLDSGLTPDVQDESGAAAIHQAAWRGQVEVVQLLRDRGASVAVRDELYRQTPREWAIDGAEHAHGARDNCLTIAAMLERG